MSTMTDNISNVADVLDVRDIIARFEELREEAREAFEAENPDAADATLVDEDYGSDGPGPWSSDPEEYKRLASLLADLEGAGGDEQWEGVWYPVTLIHEDYFEDYARQLAEDIGSVPADYSWPASHIDWEAAASALLMDYTSVDFDGQTYYTR